MSNLTEGRKALSDGDFATAERKLLKALDNHPDDGELWWSVMLCKFGFRDDGELENAVKSKFAKAAESVEPVPPTPFDTSYCKNALKYAKTERRLEFVNRVNSELSDIWAEKRGKPLRFSVVKKTERMSRTDVMRIVMYVAVALTAIGGGIASYAVFAHSTWALWSGFGALIAFGGAAIGSRFSVKRAGGSVKAALAMMILIFALTGIALFVAGFTVGSKSVVILGAAIVVVTAFVGVSNVALRTKSNGNRSGVRNNSASKGKTKSARSSYDRSNVAAALEARTGNKDDGVPKKNKKESDNEYKDAFD